MRLNKKSLQDAKISILKYHDVMKTSRVISTIFQFKQ